MLRSDFVLLNALTAVSCTVQLERDLWQLLIAQALHDEPGLFFQTLSLLMHSDVWTHFAEMATFCCHTEHSNLTGRAIQGLFVCCKLSGDAWANAGPCTRVISAQGWKHVLEVLSN